MSLSAPDDFAADVLAILQSRRVTFHGCKPDYLEQQGPNVKIWFYGNRNGRPWRGGITVIAGDVENALATGDSNVLADLCEKIIDTNNSRYI